MHSRLRAALVVILALGTWLAPAAEAARVPTREIPAYKELEIYGEKIFTVDDVALTGNFSRFASENFQSVPGFRYSSQLRLTLDGNVAKNIRINAQIDDTNLDREEKKLTLAIDGRNFTTTLGDFQTSFSDTDFTLNNKKLKGAEFYGYLPDRGDVTVIASRSEGKSLTEVFTGAGMQAEFLLKSSPVVKNSEVVKLDGSTLRRGTDYTIDYEAGSFTLRQTLLPLETRNRLDVEYEYYPEGSVYRRTLLGTRLRAYRSASDYVGVTLLSDADEKGSPDNTTDPGSVAPPNATRVAGFDFRLTGPRDLELSGEFANSSVDPNTLTKTSVDGIRSGHAGRAALALKEERYDLKVTRTEMDPKFESVGKERLTLDRELTDLACRYSPKGRLTLDFTGAVGRSNLTGDPDLPESAQRQVSVDKRSGIGAATWKFTKETSATLGASERRKENAGQNLGFVETLRDATVRHTFRGLANSLRVSRREVRNAFLPVTDRFEDQIEAGVSGSPRKDVTVAVNGSTLASETGDARAPEADVTNVTVSVTANPSQKFFAAGTVSGRDEKRFVENRRDSETSGDVRMQYNPTEKLQTQAQVREIHSRQFTVTQHDPVLQALTAQESEKDNIIRVNEPVSTRTGSFMVNYLPTPRTSALAQLQFKDITNLETRAAMAVSDSAMLEFKTNPRPDLTTILRSMLSANEQNAGEKYSTTQATQGFEVRKSLSPKTTLTGALDLEKIRDTYNPLLEHDQFKKSAKVERNVTRALVVSAGLAQAALTRFAPDRDTAALSWLAGASYTPEGSRLTARGNVERETENDLGYDNVKTVVDTLVNFNVDEDTFVESNYKFIARSKNAVEAGYGSRIGKVTVTKRF